MFNLKNIAPSWRPILEQALANMDAHYLAELTQRPYWLPGPTHIFNAFKLPLDKTRYILFGESPYPREISANGYAFWDGQVGSIWTEHGLSKPVNRATSLRNIIKMLLLADNSLSAGKITQAHIAALDKTDYVDTLAELFENFLAQGFLLLNTTLVLSERKVQEESRYWLPFMNTVLAALHAQAPSIQLLLFGKVSEKIEPLAEQYQFRYLKAEHPYNLSFITNPAVLAFFKPLNLLKKSATVGTIRHN